MMLSHIESQVEIIEFQELACEIIRQAWLDSGSHKPNIARDAVQFALSRDFDRWAELAELSELNAERIRLDIEIRAESSEVKRQKYRGTRRAARTARTTRPTS